MHFSNRLIEIDADINEYPDVFDDPAGEITIGDLHGNALYLLNTLIRLRIIKLPRNYFEHFKTLYYKDVDCWQDADFTLLKEIFSHFRVYNHRNLRLLGDIFADRGKNDFLTLKILECLDDNGADYTITLSNHDMEFISYLEQTNLFHQDYEVTISSPEKYSRSLQNFQKLLTSKTLSTETKNQYLNPIKLKATIKKCLFRHLKAIDYNFSGDWEARGLVVFSHAAVDLKLIEQIAKELGTSFNKSTIKELAKSIDAMNEALLHHLQAGNLIHLFHELYPSKNIRKVDASKQGASALSRLLWNRDICDLDFKSAPLIKHFVHGHDKKTVAQGVYTLDGDLGSTENLTKGVMTIWALSHENLGDCLTVETTYKKTKDHHKTLCIDQYRQISRFQVRVHDSIVERATLEVPLPDTIDEQEAERRLKTLYRYRSHLSQAEALLVASPIFDYEIGKLEAAKDTSRSTIISPSLFTDS